MVALLTIPSIAAQRYEGTNFILTTSEFRDCQDKVDNGTNFRTISCHHPITEHMENKTPLDLKNYFYWIINPYGVPIPPVIACLVEILNPTARNYTYSINIPLEYVVNASNLTIAEITSNRFSRNITLTGLLAGSERFDVPYDDLYTVNVSGNTTGGACSAVVSFAVDRTSDFGKNKSHVMAFIIFFMVGISGYIYMVGRTFRDDFQLLIKSLVFFFVYSAFILSLLAAREYIKVPSIYSQLIAVYSASMIIFNLLIGIMVVLFIIDLINYYQKRLLNKWEGTEIE